MKGLLDRSPILRVTIVACSTAAGLLLAEALVRLFFPQALLVPSQDEVNGVTTVRPNVFGRNCIPGLFDVTISTNAQRFRGPKNYNARPGPDVLRVAALGDSFTFGGGAGDDESYPAQLERLLQARLVQAPSTHTSVEVINAGTPGTGTGEQALWYANWVSGFRPQVVILTVISNDVDDDLLKRVFVLDGDGRAAPRPAAKIDSASRHERRARRLVNAIPGYRFLAQRSELIGLARIAGSSLIGRPWGTAPDESRPSPQPQNQNERFRNEGLPLLRGEVLWLEERVRASGAQLAVLYVPFPECVYPDGSSDSAKSARKYETIANTLRELCSEHQIPFSDLTPALREEARKNQRRLYYSDPDFHPTPEGYRVIAETAAALLANSGLLRWGEK